MHRILITGGTGFLGTNVYQYIRRAHPDTDIYLFSRRTGGNIKDAHAVARAIAGMDFVIHAAAQSHVGTGIAGTPEAKRQFEETNYLGTKNVIAACLGHAIPMVHISTAEIYGSNQFPGTLMTEEHPINPQMGVYAESKLAADRAVQEAVAHGGLNARIIRPFGMYGPFQSREKFFPKVIGLVREGKPITIDGDGLQVRDYVSIEDVARAIWLLAEAPTGTIVNVCTSIPHTLKDMAEMLLASLKRQGIDGQIMHQPDRPNQVREFVGSYGRLKEATGWEPEKRLEEEIHRLVNTYLSSSIEPQKMFYRDEI